MAARPGRQPRPNAGEIAISLALMALAAGIAFQTLSMDSAGGYSAVGPRFSPLLVAIGLGIVGALLLRESLAGGWRGMAGAQPAERFAPAPFAWIAGGLLVHMALIGAAGFTLASTLLFAAVARGMGSRRVVRDVAIGFLSSAAVFVLFTRVLSLSLPALVRGVV